MGHCVQAGGGGAGGGRSPECHQEDYLQGFGLLVLMFGATGWRPDLRTSEGQTSSCVPAAQVEQQKKEKEEEGGGGEGGPAEWTRQA